MDIRLFVVAYLMICILPVAPSPYRSRSRNKNSAPTYDQKQTGEYNIQLHLKDFEVVALLNDGAFGEGDYDYNYDYSEITVKPSTPKPITSTTSKTEPTTPEAIPTTQEVQSTTQQSTTTTSQPPSTAKLLAAETKLPPITEKSTTLPTSSSTLPSVRLENELENITKEEFLKQSTVRTEIIVKPVENLTIVDNKEQTLEENLPLVVHRKCASGFTRDKNGRCRRVRRPAPNFSFGISRLANLASKLRQGTNDSQTNDPTTVEE